MDAPREELMMICCRFLLIVCALNLALYVADVTSDDDPCSRFEPETDVKECRDRMEMKDR